MVLFLQIEGECEREMGGNPLPPLTSVSDPDYPLPPLAGRAPWRPMGRRDNFLLQKCKQVILGLPDRAKRRRSVESPTWSIRERQSAKSCSKRTFAIWTSQDPRFPRTRLQKRESDFCNFFVFWKFQKFFTF